MKGTARVPNMAFRLLSSSFSEETLYSLLAPCTRVIKKLGTLRIARAGEGMQNGVMGQWAWSIIV